MTLVNKWFTLKVSFDMKGNWVTASTGTRVYIPFGLIYEPDSKGGDMYGVSILFVLAAVLIRKRA